MKGGRGTSGDSDSRKEFSDHGGKQRSAEGGEIQFKVVEHLRVQGVRFGRMGESTEVAGARRPRERAGSARRGSGGGLGAVWRVGRLTSYHVSQRREEAKEKRRRHYERAGL